MRLPRLPRIRGRMLQTATKPSGARIKVTLIGLALLLVSFFISFYLFFPANALRGRIEKEVAARTPAELTIEQMALLFPPGLEGSGITVKTGNPQLKSVAVSDLVVKPLWTTLFSGNPGLALQARLFGGTLEGTVRHDGAIAAQLNRISFNEPLLAKSGIELAGVLRQGSYSGALPLRAQTATHLNLSLHNVRLTGLKAFGIAGGKLDLGTISLVGEGRGNSFRIETFKATGGNLEITGGGTVLVVTPLDRSRLNLNVVLRPGRNLDKNLTGLLNLVTKPARDGAYHLRIAGSLARPAIH